MKAMNNKSQDIAIEETSTCTYDGNTGYISTRNHELRYILLREFRDCK